MVSSVQVMDNLFVKRTNINQGKEILPLGAISNHSELPCLRLKLKCGHMWQEPAGHHTLMIDHQ